MNILSFCTAHTRSSSTKNKDLSSAKCRPAACVRSLTVARLGIWDSSMPSERWWRVLRTAGSVSLIDEVGDLAVFCVEMPVDFVHTSLYVGSNTTHSTWSCWCNLLREVHDIGEWTTGRSAGVRIGAARATAGGRHVVVRVKEVLIVTTQLSVCSTAPPNHHLSPHSVGIDVNFQLPRIRRGADIDRGKRCAGYRGHSRMGGLE
ncbi:hypothetical protein DFH08DRAFT_881327, partial [Mycena albidolilacea]